MPTLDWIGKKAVLNHHNEVPYHLLHCNPELSVGEASGNLLVQGDNLLALKALLPYYAGQVKCIYIDPPYNTGEEGWIYNDNVSSKEIKLWLGEVVGKEGEDLSRHDKWLCMMYPRIALLKEFLRDDGVIFVSIDEFEVANLRLLLREIFGPQNDMGTMVWKRRSSSAMSGTPLSIDHEYVLVFCKNRSQVKIYGLAKGIENYPYRDSKGSYTSTDLTVGMGKDARPGQFYTIRNPRTGKEYPPNPERVWRFFPETMQKIIEADLIIWPDDFPERNMQRPRYKTYYDPESLKPKPISSWIESAGVNDREIQEDEIEFEISILSTGMNQEGGKLLQKMFGSKSFAYPKPLSLVRSLMRASTRSGDIVMDSFAGSGTAGHATIHLNQEDDNNRQFILIEMDSNVARTITAERLRRVVQGYEWKDQRGNLRQEEGLGGGFRFCELGPTLFDASGQIRPEVSFADLARHVFFVETGQPLPASGQGTVLLGDSNGTAVYLLYNGVMRDAGNMLTSQALEKLPPFDGPKVIYADGCKISRERLRELGVTFKQIPYQIQVR